MSGTLNLTTLPNFEFSQTDLCDLGIRVLQLVRSYDRTFYSGPSLSCEICSHVI